MIKSIRLINYESHKDTTVEFDDHFNILAGKSASGKSSINRAVQWVTSNTSGSSYVSWWCLGKPDKKGVRSQKDGEVTSVTLYLDNGHRITRARTSKTNTYQIDDDKPFEAVGGGSVPEQIAALLNFSDVNIQGQFSPQFLVSQSSGEVAKYLNKIINLEDADIYQTAVEAKRRKCSTDLEAARKSALSTETELKGYDWVEKASSKVSKLEKLEADNTALSDKVRALDMSMTRYDMEVKRLESCTCIPRAEQLSTEIRQLLAKKVSSAGVLSKMEASLQRYDVYQKETGYVDIIEKAEKIIKKASRLEQSQGTDRANLAKMINSSRKYVALVEELEATKAELTVAEREFNLIDMCPYCGNKISHEHLAF